MVLSMGRWNNKVAIITGAGGGIGAAIVEKLLEQNLQVVAVDLRQEFLDNLEKNLKNKKNNLFTFKIDVNQEEEVVKLFRKVTETIGPVHILINCAGILQQTDLIDGDVQKWRKVFDVNVIGLSIMTREAVKIMKINDIDGLIVNFCSIAGHGVPDIPGLNMYPASKHAVKAISETLRQELNRLQLKIKITNLSPVGVATSIIQNNFEEASESVSDDVSPKVKPEDVADGVVYVLSTPPHVQVHEWTIKPVGEIY